jgi:hypothetical protein
MFAGRTAGKAIAGRPGTWHRQWTPAMPPFRIDGDAFVYIDPIRYMHGRAAEHDGRWATVNSLALLSTDTGDAWLLDPKII